MQPSSSSSQTCEGSSTHPWPLHLLPPSLPSPMTSASHLPRPSTANELATMIAWIQVSSYSSRSSNKSPCSRWPLMDRPIQCHPLQHTPCPTYMGPWSLSSTYKFTSKNIVLWFAHLSLGSTPSNLCRNYT
jgi:hypothetical protein